MTLLNDLQLDVATANSRKAKTWKNKTMLWSQIIERFSKTTHTAETQAEYKKFSRSRQADVKDVGGFVGGFCNNGHRTDVRHRSILALDADYAVPGLWEDFTMLYGCAAAIYSTHKHTPEKPRLRLVLPLARNVTPDEFQAIGRRIASDLGIDQFDDSTYQPQRLMYWPSTSLDGEFIFDYLDAPVLNPDTVLATYTDWKDVSSWPMSSRVTDIVRKAADKQQDPLEKGGLIGAFCRAYPIEEAIEAFVPEYTPCTEPGRYTYTLGTTSGGVILYDDKFSYSFHATDPTSGILCNAWDLVRLHKFHDLDEDVEPGKAVNSRPSWAAMVTLASEDARVKSQLLSDRAADFDAPAEDGDWTSLLKFTKDGSVASTIDNIVVILTHDTKLAGRLRYDEMAHSIVTGSSLPWRSELGAWTDSDDASLRYYLEKHYGLSGKDRIFDAVNVTAMAHRFHPVRDYLDSCAWDEIPRIDTLLVDYLGAEDSAYTRAVTRKTLVAAVARIYNPGCKFDYMLAIRGKQGLGKSAFIKRLGGEWFSDSFSTMQGKDAYDQLQGSWIIEVGELAGMRKAEAETIKLYISKSVDRYRPAYGRRTQEFPRQCIFIGTTNESQFLRDSTGNRRFWVVDTPDDPKKDMWQSLDAEEVKKIWAEAVLMYQNGEPLYLSKELEEEARRVQEAFEEENPKAGIVAEYLDRLLPENWYDLDLYARRLWLEGSETGVRKRIVISAVEIWAEALGGNPEKTDRYAIKEIHDIMHQLPEWKRMGDEHITIHPYGRQKYYRRLG